MNNKKTTIEDVNIKVNSEDLKNELKIQAVHLGTNLKELCSTVLKNFAKQQSKDATTFSKIKLNLNK